jgi:hypothetical protein
MCKSAVRFMLWPRFLNLSAFTIHEFVYVLVAKPLWLRNISFQKKNWENYDHLNTTVLITIRST